MLSSTSNFTQGSLAAREESRPRGCQRAPCHGRAPLLQAAGETPEQGDGRRGWNTRSTPWGSSPSHIHGVTPLHGVSPPWWHHPGARRSRRLSPRGRFGGVLRVFSCLEKGARCFFSFYGPTCLLAGVPRGIISHPDRWKGSGGSCHPAAPALLHPGRHAASSFTVTPTLAFACL